MSLSWSDRRAPVIRSSRRNKKIMEHVAARNVPYDTEALQITALRCSYVRLRRIFRTLRVHGVDNLWITCGKRGPSGRSYAWTLPPRQTAPRSSLIIRAGGAGGRTQAHRTRKRAIDHVDWCASHGEQPVLTCCARMKQVASTAVRHAVDGRRRAMTSAHALATGMYTLALFEDQTDGGMVSRPGLCTYDSHHTSTIEGSGANLWGKHDDVDGVWRRMYDRTTCVPCVSHPSS